MDAQPSRSGNVALVTAPSRQWTGCVPDAGVRVQDAGRIAADDRTRRWLQTKHPSDASPIPIATWKEAQRILAEAEGGQSAVDHINAVRIR